MSLIYMELQPIPRGYDLEALPPGLYATLEFKRGDYFSIVTDQFYRDVRQQLVIRIDDDQRIPFGVEAAYIRGDGRRVVKAWIYADYCYACVFGRGQHAPECEAWFVSAFRDIRTRENEADRQIRMLRREYANAYFLQFVKAPGAVPPEPNHEELDNESVRRAFWRDDVPGANDATLRADSVSSPKE